MTVYTIRVEMPSDVPEDVVQEYIGQALKRFVQDRTTVKVLREPKSVEVDANGGYARRVALRGPVQQQHFTREHPFEGPEVFDDDVTAATFTEVPEGGYPRLAELLGAKRESITDAPVVRPDRNDKPFDEGDWQLDSEADHTGED